MALLIELIFIIVVVIVILSNIGYFKIAKTLKNIPNESELSGFEIAKKVTTELLKTEPHIIKKKGKYNDHYNSNRDVIKLSPEVFDGTDMYAGSVAIHIALETEKEKDKINKGNLFASFLVMASYIMIILGACLSNSNIIHFGFILFILAFALIIVIGEVYGGAENELDVILDFIKKEGLLKPFDDEIEDNFILLAIIPVARLPYRFLNYFV